MSSQSEAQVLVVDDDQTIRETLRFLLEDEGYTVLEASEGAKALEILRKSPGGLVVLLDLMMPRVNGMEVMEQVAADPHLASRHAYTLLTANDRTLPLAFVNLLNRLRVPIISKPFEIDAVLNIVEQASRSLVREIC